MTKNQGPIGVATHRKRQKARLRTGPIVDSDDTDSQYGPNTPVAIYTRVSTEEQADSGLSLSAQKRVSSKFAQDREWDVVHIYEDPGFSGKNDERPGFQEMLSDARQGRYKVLLVHKLDRFSRNIGNTLKNFRELNECDVTLVSVTEDFDYSTPMGRMFFHMMAVFAQWYLENLSAETSKGKKERVKQGLHNGQLPFGYKNVGPKKPGVVVPEEAKAIKKAFELYSTGEYSDRKVGNYLNENGFNTRNRRRWSKDTVREFLQNDYYYGVVRYKDEIWPGKQEPIISEELFKTCLAVRKKRASRKKSYSASSKRIYILQRLVRCDHCERNLRIQATPKYRYYKEASRSRGLTCAHAGTSIRMDVADSQVQDALNAIRLPDDWQKQIDQLASDLTKSNKIEKERKSIQEKLRRLGHVYADRIISEQEYERERDALQAKLENLFVPDKAVVFDYGLRLENLGPYLEAASKAEKFELFHLILDAVYANVQTDQVTRLKPKPEFLHLFRLAAEETGWEEKEPGIFSL